MENIEANKENYKWIEQLALEEINMDNSLEVDLTEHLSPEAYLEQSSIDYVSELRLLFEEFTKKFNLYRSQNENAAQIKVFKIAHTVNDFMLYRNSLRLIISRRSNDLIRLAFVNQGNQIFSARENSSEVASNKRTHDIRAHIGPFNSIKWQYNGEDIEASALVKHYFSEFVKNSAH